jgi:tetratricopeptide (TPR) repeat protein
LLQEDFNRAVSLLKQSLALHQQLEDKRGTAAALKNLATAARAQGDAGLARAYCAESLSVYEQLGDRRNALECRARLAELAGVDDSAFGSRTIA